MSEVTPILIGKGAEKRYLLPGFANRHGLITGATGTGKTVTLQILAEGFSRIGVPVFLADVKGDLAGLSQPGKPHPKVDERIEKIGIDGYSPTAWPVVFWDLFGESGHPVRTTVSEMGPMLLANLLELNDTQEGVLNIAFRIADEQGLLLLDLEDLRALLRFVAENAQVFSREYGNISGASVAAIQRRLLVLDEQGAELFFGEPALDLADIRRTDLSGRGVINVLAADRLIHKPRLYATFLLWLLSELFEELPEVGDPEKPGLVFFFDEAHLLFKNAPRALLEQVEQVVRLIRSKGVGVFFVTQNPADVPEAVLGQLGNRLQHAMRAYTPREKKAIRIAAQTFRSNPALDVETAFMQMGVGEALVSTLQEKGIPGMVDQVLIRPPESRIGPVSPEERAATRSRSPVGDRYDETLDRESAAEMLAERANKKAEELARAERAEQAAADARKAETKKRSSSRRQSPTEAAVKSFLRSVSSTLGREIMRGVLGAIRKG
ncbi:MAG: helicase HerA-like domain-containing protein [Xanthomonadales bacterium]|jgi:DNA helicase HerA-like ATPase|nr:helicase HerA-like domain-containing protein [Xanthomonadales bacterium]